MKNIIIALLLSVSHVIVAQTASDRDTKFAREAMEYGILEIKLAELAQSKASTQVVKIHAQHMIEDHTKINAELKDLAAKKNISLPTAMGEKQQKIYDMMSKLNGKDFDKKYAKCMIKGHKSAICDFKNEARKGDDAELVTWALQTKPIFEHHREMWKEACKEIRK